MRAVHEKGGFCGWDVKMSGLRHKCPFGGASVVQKEKMFREKRGRCSAASSASARLSKKVEQRGRPTGARAEGGIPLIGDVSDS